ncbi:MAG: helix-turn-helix transcriptional regulator [Bacteroidales bacterium]|jgi:hypothetical protein
MLINKNVGLTDTQLEAVKVLREAGGQWLTSRQVWDKMNPDGIPIGRDLNNMGNILRWIPAKDSRVEISDNIKPARYRWNDVAGVTVDTGGACPTALPLTKDYIERTLMMVKADSTWDAHLASGTPPDHAIIFNALMHYARATMQVAPETAIRAAFLAGQGGFFRKASAGSTKRSKPAPHEKQDVECCNNCEDEPAEWIPATMPASMDYDEFMAKTQAAYKACEFTYADVAKRANMQETYVRDIIRGVATPSRARLAQVYAAAFHD